MKLSKYINLVVIAYSLLRRYSIMAANHVTCLIHGYCLQATREIVNQIIVKSSPTFCILAAFLKNQEVKQPHKGM